MTHPEGFCSRCLMPWDAHCFLHEPVILCPVLLDGALKTPCKMTGPKYKEVPT